MTYTNTIRIRTFTLYLYPDYSQTATGIPYVVDLTPCRTTYNFYTNSNPSDLVLTRTSGSTIHSAGIYPTYYNYWYVQHSSYCPVLRYTIEDNSGNSWTDTAKFTLQN
jgi:hypothetical protein